ncbi:efflux RND transporter permease subunit [Paremcibacter congregatus]|uniref:efflux RND transporter permease subunit n=1 Tax=Paremcibacter congregatus TaxID=2043170 RepID=UPI003A945293
MLNKLIDFGIMNRLLVLLALLGLLAAGGLMLPRLNLDAFPDVTNVQVTINTEAPGLAAREVEQLITFPIEAVMYALPDVEEVRSISKSGLSGITVVFKEGTDIYFARQLVFERLQAAREDIPAGVGVPEMGPNTSGLGQVYQYVLLAEDSTSYDAMTLRSLNDWVVKLLLMPIEGVTDVLSFGGEVRQYQVQLNPDRLLRYDLTPADIQTAIEDNNRNAGGWYLDRGREQLVIRGVGWIRSGARGLEDIAAIPLKEKDGSVVHIRDVARVVFGGEIRQGAVTLIQRGEDGAPVARGEVVTGIVLKRLGANSKQTIDSIDARQAMIQAALPDGVRFEPIYDQADLVSKAVATVTDALLQAFVLIVVVLFLFLLNLRAAGLVLLSIPLSILMALVVMSAYGMSANLMSLGGMAIAIGMMVDGSVVMMENIFRHMARQDRVKILGTEPHGTRLLIQEAAREVGRPVFFAVMIIVVVFAPLFSLEGVEGKLFQPMALSIVMTMLGSLVVALMVLPALASYLFARGVREKVNPPLVWLEDRYRQLLVRALARGRRVMSAAGIIFVLSMGLVPYLGTEFVPELEEGTLNIRVTLAPSSSLDTSLEVAKVLEGRLMTFPEVLFVSARIGRAEIGGDPEPVSNIELLVGLKDVRDWTTAGNRSALQDRMAAEMAVLPGLLFSFSQPIATRVDELLSGVKAQLAIKLFGADLDILAAKGREIADVVRATPGARDVALEQVSGEAQLVIIPRRDRLARYGLSVGQVMALVSDAIGGATAGQVIQGNERYDITVRLQKPFRQDREAIANLTLISLNGAWVRLKDVAEVRLETGPTQIRRDNVQRRVVVQANVAGRDMGGLVDELTAAIRSKVDLPPGYAVEIGGQYENQQRAQARLMIVVPLSMGLIFLLLYFAFGSMKLAGLIMINVPLALIGGVVALFVSGQYLSVPGAIGFITLFGIAILNGVVLVNAFIGRLAQGHSLAEAIREGTVSRLRPVLMTALTSLLGLIPLLLATGVGAEIQRPLATVVVGGIITCTVLTLFILPVVCQHFMTEE